ncbi:MAG: hypothetical protein ABI382_04980, partial [Nakamurella sp.]
MSVTGRPNLRRRVNEIAFRQAGYFAAAQARSAGFSYQAQKCHVDRGNWDRVDRAFFRLPEWPSDADDAFARWSVWSACTGVVSHESAAAVHDFGELDPNYIHLTVPNTMRKNSSGVVLHRAPLTSSEIESRPTFRVTTALRTILDLATSDITQEQLNSVVADATTRNEVTEIALHRTMDDF